MRIRGRKVLQGTVHRSQMSKTITVDVERRVKHPKYGKFVVTTKRFAVHDETNDARDGDVVEIAETRPQSTSKRWRLLKVLRRAPTRGEATA